MVGLLGRALASGIGAIEARLETAWVLKLVGVEFSGLIRIVMRARLMGMACDRDGASAASTG